MSDPLSAASFAEHVKVAEEYLRPQHFFLQHTEYNDADGSHLAQFVRNDEQLHLQWNGKEEWLVITHSNHAIHTQTPSELFFRSLRNTSETARDQAVTSALSMLRDYTTSHVHDDDDVHCCGCSHHHA